MAEAEAKRQKAIADQAKAAAEQAKAIADQAKAAAEQAKAIAEQERAKTARMQLRLQGDAGECYSMQFFVCLFSPAVWGRLPHSDMQCLPRCR